MEPKDYDKYREKYSFQGLGKWYSWDTPTGLTLAFSVSLLSIGLFIYLLHLANLF